MSMPGPITCAACGEEHIDTDEALAASLRIGIALVHPDCQWTIRYPGMRAHEVIADLERRLGGAPPAVVVGAQTVAAHDNAAPGDPPPAAPGPPEDDPATRVGASTALTGMVRIPCPTCGGDGELTDGTICGRCNGEGTVLVEE